MQMLAVALYDQYELGEAIAVFRETLRLEEKVVVVYVALVAERQTVATESRDLFTLEAGKVEVPSRPELLTAFFHLNLSPSHQLLRGEALLNFLDTCVGVAVVSDQTLVPQHIATELLEDHVLNRLDWPWLVPTPLDSKRIVVIGEKRDPAGCERFYKTAKECGVSVVVMDRPGHWMQDSAGPGQNYREHFIPFPGFASDDVAERIVTAIRSLPYMINNIVTTMDPLLQGVAKAAEMLRLPTCPSEAYRRATNRYETRLMQTSDTMLLVSGTEDLRPQLDSRQLPLSFPLIVRPTRNHGSYGVSKVQNETDLYAAVQHAITFVETQHTTFGAQTAETNNGESLFSEVVDNFPCMGDDASSFSKTEQFVETGLAWPSALPYEEIELLRSEMLDIVKRIGFETGVIHARSSERPKSFLLEINPRPPGQSDSLGSAYVNSVDYYALYIMQAIGDETRFRSLACPFSNGPQCHLATSPIPIRMSGRLASDINIESTSRDYPEIPSNMLMLHPFYQKGEMVPDRDELRLPWLGFCVVASRRGRRDLMEKVMIVRDELQFEVTPVSAFREHKLSLPSFVESQYGETGRC
ncbi:hypothetical protein F5B22DRAFT_647965 [Xylaria bambusicola]|uniref:uncharacterized protein n=1 Tax=Xylaria bambusicola TaxID=326684 RepID=UPI0020076F59|nr:uncharacterized protein F5B22DRAFT_647965 [Xylaria bambusicola]KAI0513153.1 hypothetical protein F5B22DRAFT_647965 [Xylaria bambusicola]